MTVTNAPLRMGTVLKIGMYLLSLWLLFILVIVNKIDIPLCLRCGFASRGELLAIARHNFIPLICLVLLLISWGFYFHFKRLIQESKEGPYKVEELEDKNAENLVFLATYVIPLVAFGLADVRQLLDLMITLVMLAAIYVRTNLFYANPTLSILGFKVFSVKIQGGMVILITREDIEVGQSVNAMHLDRKVFFAKKALVVTA